MRKPLDLKQLQHFVAVYEYGSLLSAAHEVGVGQSALTKSLKKLEEQLGLALFTRHTRELKPTAAGQQLYDQARKLLAEAKEFERSAQGLVSGNKGTVSIGCGAFPADVILVPLIQTIRSQGADINLRFTTEPFDDLIFGLLSYRYDFLLFDVGKLEELPEPERFQVTPLFKMPVDIVLSKSLYDSVTPLDPMQPKQDLKWANTGQNIPQRFLAQFPEEHQREIRERGGAEFQIESIHSCLALARQGLVATFAPSSMVADDLSTGSLVRIETPFDIEVHVGIYTLRSRSMDTTTQKVIALLNDIDFNVPWAGPEGRPKR